MQRALARFLFLALILVCAVVLTSLRVSAAEDLRPPKPKLPAVDDGELSGWRDEPRLTQEDVDFFIDNFPVLFKLYQASETPENQAKLREALKELSQTESRSLYIYTKIGLAVSVLSDAATMDQLIRELPDVILPTDGELDLVGKNLDRLHEVMRKLDEENAGLLNLNSNLDDKTVLALYNELIVHSPAAVTPESLITLIDFVPPPRQEIWQLIIDALTAERSESHQDAVEIYDSVLETFSAERLGKQTRVFVLRQRAISQARIDLDKGLAELDALIDAYGRDEAPEIREEVAHAMFSRAFFLHQNGRLNEALIAYDAFLDAFSNSDEPNIRAQVAGVLSNKSVLLMQQDKPSDALGTQDLLIQKFKDDSHPTLHGWVIRTEVAKGMTLMQSGRANDALEVFEQATERYGNSSDTAVLMSVVIALQHEMSLLLSQNEIPRALEKADELLALFKRNNSPVFIEFVVDATEFKARILNQLKRFDEALAAVDEALELLAAGAQSPPDEVMARLEFVKGFIYDAKEDIDGGIAFYSAFLDRFGNNPDPQIQSMAAASMHLKAELLLRRGDKDESVALLREFVERFGNSDDTIVKRMIAAAQQTLSAK